MGNFLNFVYDNVDVTEQNIKNYMLGYLGISGVRTFHINDIPNDDEKYYYFFEYRYYLAAKIISTKKLPLSDTVQNLLKSNSNFNLIVSNDAESDDGFLIEYLDNLFKDMGVDTNKIIVINCNEKNLDLKHRINSLIKTHTTNNGKFAYTNELTRFPYEYKEDRNFLFMCYNRAVKNHRFALLVHLMKHNIIDTIDWSWIRGHEVMQRFISFEDNLLQNTFLRPVFNESELVDYRTEIELIANIQRKKSVYETNYEVDYPNNRFDTEASYSNNPYSNSYINIVTETNFHNDDIIILSEKSFIPLYFSQIPIIMASTNHIKKMKDTHGFDFFDDLVNHDYDREPDSKKRFRMIIDEIIRLNNKKEEIVNFFKENKHRFEKNRQIFENIKKNKSDYNFYNSLR
jgi:hypothetical protein